MISLGLITFSLLLGCLIFCMLGLLGLLAIMFLKRRKATAAMSGFVTSVGDVYGERREQLLALFSELFGENDEDVEKFADSLVEKEQQLHRAMVEAFILNRASQLSHLNESVNALVMPYISVISDRVAVQLKDTEKAKLKLESDFKKFDDAVDNIFEQYIILTKTEINPNKKYTISRKLTMMERIPFTSILSDAELAAAKLLVDKQKQSEEDAMAAVINQANGDDNDSSATNSDESAGPESSDASSEDKADD